MNSIPRLFFPQLDTYIESQLTFFNGLVARLTFATQKISALNLQTARTLMEENATSACQLMQAQDPQEIVRITVAQIQPIAAKVQAYQQHLNNIAADTQAEFKQAVNEVNAKEEEQEHLFTPERHSEHVAERASSQEEVDSKKHAERKKESKREHAGHHHEHHEEKAASSLVSSLIENIE